MALARLLAAQGASLILSGCQAATLQQLADTLSATICPSDLCASREPLIALIRQQVPDLIINNAGYGLYGEALTYTAHEQLDLLTVNAAAVLELTLEGARALIEAGKRGTILNISSAAAFFPFPTCSVYAASKACVLSFSRALDAELAPRGVRVLTACPGQIATNFRRRASGGFSTEAHACSMTPEYAARRLLAQVRRGQSLTVFDWKTRFAVACARLLPFRLLSRLLRRTLSSRLPRK
jgi:short-subunit dehydrogenase